MAKFESTAKYKLIYIFEIHDESHKGLLKIGEATIDSSDPAALVPNCNALNVAAKSRIKSYTATAGVSFDLRYTELAIKEVAYGSSVALAPFSDKDVHAVLLNSGKRKVQPNATDGNEWFEVDLETAKNAIKAVKEGRKALTSNEITTTAPAIEFRDEQKEAVAKTLARFKKQNEMLWYAKMRFGKTLTSLEVVRQAQFRRVIIVTHRPVVGSGWQEDFGKIFRKGEDPHNYSFEFKSVSAGVDDYDEHIDAANDMNIRNLDNNKCHFIYFASIQDLRGSKRVGGKFNKNNAVFDLEWDCIIIDEAHEGTQTELGDNVVKELRKEKTKVLALSGTPFNILDQYEEDSVYTWDYVMEQRRKEEWDTLHPGDHNPYADLPQMHIFTYNLGENISGYVEHELEGKAFNFREFFRTYTGDIKVDKKAVPKGKQVGDFIHEDDVRSFLALITKPDAESLYPFSTKEYRVMFKHTLWMVPGVKEAKALSKLLREHPIFSQFGIANVAGEGDDYEDTHSDDALQLVRDTIKNNDYSITLSCGKLTTGVTVKEWTAVFMLAGSYSTAAAGYMQTIFRVQSAGQIDGKQKTDCYVFDFAPDRTLKVLAETANVSRKAGRAGKRQEEHRDAMSDFINFCPVIAVSGTEMKPYSVNTMMEELKRVYAQKAIKNGFDDASIYNDNLMRLDDLELAKFQKLKGIVGASKAAPPLNDVEINAQGFSEEEHQKAEGAKKKNKKERTPEEEELLKKLQEQRKNRNNAISILRAISIRMPLMIYGASVPFDEDISIEHFAEMVDDESWKEFMPNGVTKEVFADFSKYYDRDIFISAGKEIRKLAASTDELTPTQRVIAISRIFRYFKNPDKETVLTPWRVVNMHMSDTLGGWCFYDESFEKELEEPRYIDQGQVTAAVFGKPDSQILEINSKSGLYPLYVAYSVYRAKLGDRVESEESIGELNNLWYQVVADNVFVLCKTQMAKYITRRTLLGYRDAHYNAHYFDDLINMLKNKSEQFKKRVLKGTYWKKEVNTMRFDAIVGNPPYQSLTNGGVESGKSARQATPVFNLFVDTAKYISSGVVSMIIPARWYNGGMGLGAFRESMLNDRRLVKLFDFYNSKECFKTVDIAGGLCYFLWDSAADGECEVVNISEGTRISEVRSLNQFGEIFVRSNKSISVINKVKSKAQSFLDEYVSALDTFGIPSKEKGHPEYHEGDLTLLHSVGFNGQGESYISPDVVKKNHHLIDKYKVKISIMVPQGGETGIRPENGYRSISTPQILAPGVVDTFSYLNVGFFDTEKEAEHFRTYLQCKFTRFMLRTTYSSVHISNKNFVFVPAMDFQKKWTDADLYKYFDLSDDEIDMIEATMRPMIDSEID